MLATFMVVSAAAASIVVGRRTGFPVGAGATAVMVSGSHSARQLECLRSLCEGAEEDLEGSYYLTMVPRDAAEHVRDAFEAIGRLPQEA